MPPAASTSNARGGSSVSVAATKVAGPAISKINKGTRGQMQVIQAKLTKLSLMVGLKMLLELSYKNKDMIRKEMLVILK